MNFDPYIYPYPSNRNVVYGLNGMVATAEPNAAMAGLEVLKKGGNAIDAAVATAAALTVTEPTSNGIGGDAFALIWSGGKLHGLNSSGKSPKSISIEKVKSLGHTEMPKSGFIPVTVPGIPRAWAELTNKFGKLTLSENLTPAVKLAEEGYSVAGTVAKYWGYAYRSYLHRKDDDLYVPWLQTFAPGGSAPAPGKLFKSPSHGKTLREIAETNADSFYKGNLAKKIHEHSVKHGGFITGEDLGEFEPDWVKPISVYYNGYDVWEIPPNGQGLVALVTLNILKQLGESCLHDSFYYHKLFEAMKLAFTAGKSAITDPAHMSYSPHDFLSDEYATQLAEQITDKALDPVSILPKKGGTVYLATADNMGNMVSFIQSNYMGFGSGVVIPGTGIALQNRGADFSLDETHVNALKGGKKTYHTIIPGFVTKDNIPIGPFGVMGGYMQPQGHVQVIVNSVDFKMNPQSALDAPRWQWISGRKFEVESHFPKHIAEELQRKYGHQITIKPDSGGFGRGQIIWRNQTDGTLCGGTESRADGTVVSF